MDGFDHNACTIFTSQYGQPLYEDVGCGVASLMMLLKHLQFKPLPSYEDLCQALNLAKNPVDRGYNSDDEAVGLYPEELFRYVINNKLHFRMYFCDDEWVYALLKAPIMVLLERILPAFPEEMHWVVLTEFKKNAFVYLDPLEKSFTESVKTISFRKFKKAYTGIACQLL